MSSFFRRIANSIQKRIDRLLGKNKDSDNDNEIPEGVTWLNQDISNWRETAKLNANVTGATIQLTNNNNWPIANQRATNGGPLVGNVWVVAKIDGTWYAATWDWMRPGQQSKARSDLTGPGHLQREPLRSWVPKSGESVGFILSTPARSSERTTNEKTNISWVVWP